ncbi:MAG: hypothetical protein IT305_31325 [Chloroflexi bacterium]|nr:hypothetical protein [Chloroflexota bacterium]
MAKSLKEALLEKFSDLQQLGIAPTTAPVEDDLPAVVVEMGSERYGESGGRRQRSNRGAMYDDELSRGGDVPIRPRSPRRGRERGERGPGRPPAGGGERFRRGERGERPAGMEDLAGGPPALRSGPGAGPRPPFGERPAGPRPPFGERPVGPRPPFGDRPGGRPMGGPPRMGDQRGPGGPGAPGGPGMGTTDRLRQRAEQRRRDEELREQLLGLLSTTGGVEATPEVYDKFLADLTVETGALPPIERVVEAIQLAKSIEPAKVGNAVRQLFRRPRPRPAAPRPPAPAASQG